MSSFDLISASMAASVASSRPYSSRASTSSIRAASFMRLPIASSEFESCPNGSLTPWLPAYRPMQKNTSAATAALRR